MYKIDFAKQLDKDTANVEIEGEITFAKEPMNFKSKPEDKKQYDFWSQWLFVRDDTESMGVSITIGKEEDKVEQGAKIKVRGRIDEWTDRDGVLQKKLMGRIVKSPVEVKVEVKEEVKEGVKEEVKVGVKEEVGERRTKVTNVVNKVTEGTVKNRGEVEKRNRREKAVEISSKLVVADKLEGLKGLFSFAEKIVKYIYGNYKEETKEEEEEEKKIVKVGGETKLEVRTTPEEILQILKKKANLQTWKEVLYYATLADICPVETTEGDIQKILTDDNKLIQKVINTRRYRIQEEEKEKLEKVRVKAKKEEKIKAKEIEVDEYLKEIFTKAKEVGLKTWKEIIYFAVKSDVFQPGIDVSEAKERLFQHTELYNALLEAIEVEKAVRENISGGEEPTDDIPF